MICVILFSLALGLAAPALAQESAIDPAAQARAEAGMQALNAALGDLKPQADAIRADATLSETEKRERLLALLPQKEAELQAFETLVAEFTRAQLIQDGSPSDQVELGVEITRQHLMAAILDNFVAGRPLF